MRMQLHVFLYGLMNSPIGTCTNVFTTNVARKVMKIGCVLYVLRPHCVHQDKHAHKYSTSHAASRLCTQMTHHLDVLSRMRAYRVHHVLAYGAVSQLNRHVAHPQSPAAVAAKNERSAA